MFVKKFEAPTLEDALQIVKREMGSEALILSTQERKAGLFGRKSIEITAASAGQSEKHKPLQKPKFDEAALAKLFPHRRERDYVASQVSSKQVSNPVLSPLPTLAKSERYIDMDPLPPQERENVENNSERYSINFTRIGISDERARELSKRLVYDYAKSDLNSASLFEKAKSRLLSSGLKVFTAPELFTRASWVPIGVAGSGKTTILVKLALLARAQEKSVALVSLDSRKVVGRTELAGYARVIKVPFSTEITPHSQKKLCLIDSPALSMSNDKNSILRNLTIERSSFIVLDATARFTELMRQVERALVFSPAGIVFTRLDLTEERGVLYEVLKQSQLPLIGISLSPSFSVPFRFLPIAELGGFFLKGDS